MDAMGYTNCSHFTASHWLGFVWGKEKFGADEWQEEEGVKLVKGRNVWLALLLGIVEVWCLLCYKSLQAG